MEVVQALEVILRILMNAFVFDGKTPDMPLKKPSTFRNKICNCVPKYNLRAIKSLTHNAILPLVILHRCLR